MGSLGPNSCPPLFGVDQHSVRSDDTYVSPALAAFLAVELHFELAMDSMPGLQHSFLGDPRFAWERDGQNAACGQAADRARHGTFEVMERVVDEGFSCGSSDKQCDGRLGVLDGVLVPTSPESERPLLVGEAQGPTCHAACTEEVGCFTERSAMHEFPHGVPLRVSFGNCCRVWGNRLARAFNRQTACLLSSATALRLREVSVQPPPKTTSPTCADFLQYVRVRPVVSTAGRPCLGRSCPPGPLARPMERKGVTLITQMLADQLHVVPAELEWCRDARLPELAEVVPVSSPREDGRMPYDIFEPVRDRRTRQAGNHLSVEDLIQDAVHAVAYVVRCIQMPRRPLPRTYRPNVVLTPAREGRHVLALPVDMRELGGDITTILIQHGLSLDEVLELVLAKEGSRLQHVVDMQERGAIRFRGSRDRRVDLITAPLTAYEWLCAYEAGEQHFAEAMPEDPVEDRPATAWAVTHLPPALSLYTPEPSEQSMIRAAEVLVNPAILADRAFFTAPAAAYEWARNEREALGHFTIFDTRRHVCIGECGPHTDLQTLIAQAIQTAPFEVRAVQILTDAVEGYPRPQLVLHEAGRSPAGGQAIEDALRSVEACVHPPYSLAETFVGGAFSVQDSLGPVLRAVARDLASIQHFRAFPLPSQMIISLQEGPHYTGGAQQHEGTTATTTMHSGPRYAREASRSGETTTTTAMVQVLPAAPAAPALRLILFRGATSASTDLSPPFSLFEHAVAHLLAQVTGSQPLAQHARILLSGALPPRLCYLQEVVLVVQESHASLPYVWDARPVGGGMQALTVDPQSQTDILSAEWRRNNWRLAINGVPEDLCARFIRAGDFLQPFIGHHAPDVTPQGHLFAMCAEASAYAWPVEVRGAGLAKTSQRELLAHLVHNVRGRRHAMGAHFRMSGRAIVLGAYQGAICIHFARPRPPRAEAVAAALADLDLDVEVHDIVRTATTWPDTAFFASSHEVAAHQTLLVPAPAHPAHFLVLLVPSDATRLADVPAASGAAVYPRRSLRTGDVLYLRQETGAGPEPASSDDAEGVSLLQLEATKRRADTNLGILSIPTPFGRRSMPRNRQVAEHRQAGACKLSLQHTVPPPQGSKCAREGGMRSPGEPESVIRLGVPQEAQAFGLEPFALSNYRAFEAQSAEMHANARALLTGTTKADARIPVKALLLFVDGSCSAQHASWSVACFVLQESSWRQQGYLAGLVPGVLPHSSAYEGELYAQFVAMGTVAWAALPAAVFYDCHSAAQATQGDSRSCDSHLISNAAASLCYFAAVRGYRPNMHHMRAHAGHAGNELADFLAKQVFQGNGQRAEPPDDKLGNYVRERAFDWLWLHGAAAYSPAWPAFDPSGDSIAAVPAASPAAPSRPATWMPNGGARQVTEFTVSARFATYNTLSAKAALQRRCLTQYMRDKRIALLGLQECRFFDKVVVKQDGILRLAGPAPEGQLGVQLWIDTTTLAGWQDQHAAVLHSTPRLLIVLLRLGQLRTAIIVGHAPTSCASPEVVKAWWAELRFRLQALPAHAVPILLLDANARYRLAQDGEQPANANAQEYEALLDEFRLTRTAAYDADGQHRRSWRPPAGDNAQATCLDYLAFPTCWNSAWVDEGTCPILDTHSDIDHTPVLASFRACLQLDQPGGFRLDREAMLSAGGRDRLALIFGGVPQVPWEADVDVHLAVVNQHHSAGPQSAFCAIRPPSAPACPVY